jgi:hypothetical protein
MSETTEDGGEIVEEREPHDGFNVEDTVIPQEWVDFGFDAHGEYIHLIPDPEAHELRCYRSISETGQDNKRLKTTISRVNFTYHFEDRVDEDPELNHFYLTDQEAETFLSFLDLMGRGRESSVGFSWWEESGMPMMEESETGIEDIHLRFTKPNGVERRVTITSAWQDPVHKMADIEGEGY